MSPRNVLVVGAGKRVLETALPAFASAPDAFRLRAIAARRERTVAAAGASHEVRTLAGLEDALLAEVDLVYVAVAKDAVPSVLAALSARLRDRVDLLLDTPVLRVKQFRHLGRLAAFRRVSVAEDTAFLPWFDAVRAALAGPLGAPRRLVLDRSAWAYHGVATAKALLGERRVLAGRRRAVAEGRAVRTLRLFDGLRAEVVEPRDYALGRVVLEAEHGVLADHDILDAAPGRTALRLAPLVEAGECVGFRAGELETRLSAGEVALMRGDPSEAGVVARQEAAKRVGFLRLLGRLAETGEAYPLAEALDDTVVDYWLEKLGRWRATPLTSARSGLARGLYGLLSRAARG